jgi:hypothetical protein
MRAAQTRQSQWLWSIVSRHGLILAPHAVHSVAAEPNGTLPLAFDINQTRALKAARMEVCS